MSCMVGLSGDLFGSWLLLISLVVQTRLHADRTLCYPPRSTSGACYAFWLLKE